MRQFMKQPGCPAAQTLVAHQAGTLSIMSQQAVGAHLTSCEFCAAELQLLTAHAPSAAASAAPPVPFAVLALAESLLGGIPRVQQQRARRAA